LASPVKQVLSRNFLDRRELEPRGIFQEKKRGSVRAIFTITEIDHARQIDAAASQP